MTQLELAKSNKISREMRYISRLENIPLEMLKKRINEGRIVLIKNRTRKIKPCAVGEGLRTKVNANLGTSKDRVSLKKELKKLRLAIECGSDTVMDLSTGGDISKTRKALLKNSSVPLGTVPIYEAVIRTLKKLSLIHI